MNFATIPELLDERARNKPPRAFRELYRAVLALLGDDSKVDDEI